MKAKKFDVVRIYYYSGLYVDKWSFNDITKKKACDIIQRCIENLRIVSVVGFNKKFA